MTSWSALLIISISWGSNSACPMIGSMNNKFVRCTQKLDANTCRLRMDEIMGKVCSTFSQCRELIKIVLAAIYIHYVAID